MKITKTIILSFAIFTLFLNLINLVFVINYESTYREYNKALIINANNDISKLKKACKNIEQPIKEYIIYKKIATCSFIAIIISFAIIIIEFALAKSKIILFSPKDWKYLRITTFTIFLASFIFAYTPLFMEIDPYSIQCYRIL